MLNRLLIAGPVLAAGLSIAAVLTAASHTLNHPTGAGIETLTWY